MEIRICNYQDRDKTGLSKLGRKKILELYEIRVYLNLRST